MRQLAYGYAAVTLFCLGIAPIAQAELKPISEEIMGEVTGQAFMQIENIDGGVDGHQFTRMTLGMDVETRVNIDDVKAGEIDGGVDFAAQHVALGHIARNDGVQYNGRTYNEGDTVHFEAFKPYIELANDANDELAGFRMGFGQARGSVSSLTSSFSGDIGLKLVSGDQEYDATLFDANTQATKYRASHIGIDDPAAAPADCASSNPTNCAPLTHLQSIIVGEEGADGVTDFTDDFIIGFQREGVDWQSPDGANVINADKGVFINLPTSMKLEMGQLIGQGVERLQTHREDMGTQLF
ncbi:hypothetical protein SAMN04487881_1798 [Marinobacter sp. es.048]|uniref:hypothetical protein n=1 Tax=Marinobacter sp. es.048 TaxID=1761795 RepID=UPI000B5910E3|nr:hypothetical protein [Marinobacter sp. es.048]SNC67007.1 hypothetical protein SAMN04487881_1798 [Marinobacter sp. es.048]